MNTESARLSREVANAERPFARKGFDLRLTQLYPQMSDTDRKQVVGLLVDQIYKRTKLPQEAFVAAITPHGLGEKDSPALDGMVSDMISAFVGLGPDITELGPEVIRWTPVQS